MNLTTDTLAGGALRRYGAALTAALLGLTLGAATTRAAAPPADSVIGNRASATYTDADSIERTVTSNLVETTVLQVYAVTLASDGSAQAPAGGFVYFPHTVTNNGNGTDTFSLTAVDADGDLTGFQFYADADSDGVPDDLNNPITVTPSVLAGESFSFLVRATVDAAATGTVDMDVTATSVGGTGVSDTNTDSVTISSYAIVGIQKSMSSLAALPGTTDITVELRYTNSGIGTALDVDVTDVLPAGMSYVQDSARWSVTGSTELDEDAIGTTLHGSSPNTIDFARSGQSVRAVVARVPAGTSGTVTFRVSIDSPQATTTLFNTATFEYDRGDGTDVTGQSSNTVPFEVLFDPGVTGTDPASQGPVNPGSTLTFVNTLTNTGNGTDTFDVSIGTSTFPAGTTFDLLASDGQTPLVDTSGNGVADTGPVAAGGTYDVYLKINLPPSASSSSSVSVQKTARSVTDPGETFTFTDAVTSISAASVDVTEGLSVSGGANDPDHGLGDNDGDVKQTEAIAPGGTASYTLFVNNDGPIADTYVFSAPVPTDWTVTFQDAATGAVISGSPVVAPGSSYEYRMILQAPADATPGDVDVDATATSPSSGATDTVVVRATVDTVRSVTVSPDKTGQVVAGGTIVYTHVITNNGNVTEGNTTNSVLTLASSDGLAGFSSTIYTDDGSVPGALDPSDSLVTNPGPLTPGASATLFVKVVAPAGAGVGTENVTTITLSNSDGTSPYPVSLASDQTVDRTTVIAGQVTITKQQALDATCTGAGASFGIAAISAGPGQCIRYRITATNNGAQPVTGVTVDDSTPPFTSYHRGDDSTGATGRVSWQLDGGSFSPGNEPGTGVNGQTGTLGIPSQTSLAAGSSLVLYFGVRVDE